MAYTTPWQFLGIWVSGDVGDVTIYTDRFGRKVAFPKSPPKEPPSVQQIHQRNRFATAQNNWRQLTDDEKQQLETATLRGALVMTGQNLFISVALKNDNLALQTLAKQTNTTLPTIAYVA